MKDFKLMSPSEQKKYYMHVVKIYNGLIQGRKEVISKIMKKGGVENSSCLVCGTNRDRLLFSKDNFNIVSCQECGFVYVNPRLNQEALQKLYASDETITYYANNIQPLSDIWFSKEYVRRLRKLSGLGFLRKGKLLDIGCARGSFVEEANKIGWSAEGVELNISEAEFGQSKGLSIYTKPIEEHYLKKDGYQVVTMWELLEHVNNPYSTLVESNRLLKKGGYLILSTPNVSGLGTRMLGKKHKHFAPPHHLNYFSLRTLSRILDKAGFEVVAASTHSLYLGKRFNLLADHYNSIFSYPFRFMRRFATSMAVLAHKGDYLLVYARKK